MGKVNAIRCMGRLPQLGTAILLGALGACALPPPPFPDLPQLGVITRITTKNMCSLGVSPAIVIREAPPATARYTVRMTNIDVVFSQPWQATAEARPGGFAEGAFPDFPAPCLGEMRLNSPRPFRYHRFEVLALDSQGQPVAYGSTTIPVSGIDRALEIERATAAGRQPVLDTRSELPTMVRPDAVPVFEPILTPTLRNPDYGP
jgi:hypothetical protein